MAMNRPIQLVVLDIDGVLTGGETRDFDLDLFAELAELNRRARSDREIPAVTICSGRPAPYVEAIMQGIGGHLPAVYENGAGLYLPQGYQFLVHPDIRSDGPIRAVRDRLEDTLVRSGQAYFQPGKEHSLSLFASQPEETSSLQRWVEEALGERSRELDLVYSVSCINLLPKGINKARGIEFLASRTGIQPDQMLGVGDSDVDLEFLELVGTCAAPANAFDSVISTVDYVSPYRAGAGLRDILEHYSIR